MTDRSHTRSRPALLIAALTFLVLTGLLYSFSLFTPSSSLAAPLSPQSEAAALTCSTDLFFSEYIEGSSNNKALEIYNGTGASITFSGNYTVGLFSNGSSTVGNNVALSGSLADGEVYVIANASASAAILAQADMTSTVTFYNGDDALVLFKDGAMIDVIGQIGVDPGTEWGTGDASTLDNTLVRKSNVTSGDANGADAFDPATEWDGHPIDTTSFLGSHTQLCGGTDVLNVSKSGPTAAKMGDTIIYTLVISNSSASAAPNLRITDTLPSALSFVSSSPLTPTSISGGTLVWDAGTLNGMEALTISLQARVDSSATGPITNTVQATTSAAGDEPANNMDQVMTTLYQPTSISAIQGAGHRSPLAGQMVYEVHGIVTALSSRGFYMQDPTPDSDAATSEGILVFTSSAPTVSLGDEVLVNGMVTEFYPGGASSGNLSTTELVGPLTIQVVSSGNALPAATVIGSGGRMPPTEIIEDDATDVESTGVFDPLTDGIDFYESMEGMRLQVNDAVVVGPTNNFGEIVVLADNGAGAGLRTPRGGIVIRPTDFNPERIMIDDALYSGVPRVKVNDHFNAPVIGVLDYSFGAFKLLPTASISGTVVSGGLAPEVTTPSVESEELSIATFNVENLEPNPNDGDGSDPFDALAAQIVTNLRAPDIIGLQEVQDNTGATDDGVVNASQTYETLIAAIQAAGGPAYEYRDIAPQNNMDGGQPGGNIRVGFLFRPDRVDFVDRAGGTATATTTVVSTTTGPQLSFSPGRIDPTNEAFTDSRKSLVGEFMFEDERLFVIVNHLNSKSGDRPLFGRFQPPALASEVQRLQQAQVLNDFVDSLLAVDRNANVVVLGDLNDFQFSLPINVLTGQAEGNEVLTNLHYTLPEEERYTYIFEGNSQVLDHILVSANLLDRPSVAFDVVHVNAEFPAGTRASDHDPAVARLSFRDYMLYLPIVIR